MTIHRHIFAIAVMLAAGVRPAEALEWTRTEIDVTPEPTATVVRARYDFHNPADRPVSILGITTTCGCTEATASTGTVAPGARGSVEVLFTIGTRGGLQERGITVQTDDTATPVELLLLVHLPAAPISPGDPAP